MCISQMKYVDLQSVDCSQWDLFGSARWASLLNFDRHEPIPATFVEKLLFSVYSIRQFAYKYVTVLTVRAL